MTINIRRARTFELGLVFYASLKVSNVQIIAAVLLKHSVRKTSNELSICTLLTFSDAILAQGPSCSSPSL